MSRNNLFFIFTHGTKVAECWNRPTADVLVKALRLLDETETRPPQPQSLTGCLHPGNEPKSCQYEGKCLSDACNHRHKTWYGARMTLEAQVDGIVYPKETT